MTTITTEAAPERTALDDEARRRHEEIRRLLFAILFVSIVGVVFLAWDALD